MLPKKKLIELKEELDSCHNPLFIFDKDCDGVCAFLLLYKYKQEGQWTFMKTRTIDANMLSVVENTKPDKIFTLDVANIEQDFVDGVSIPIIQIDHHLIEEHPKGIRTFNPRDYDKEDSSPTTTICYNLVKQNLWIAAIGTISDWHLTKETRKFARENKKLLDPRIKSAPEALFNSKIGSVARMFNFMLKGKTGDIRKNIERLMKIKNPVEILDKETEEGAWIQKHYDKLFQKYKEKLVDAEKYVGKDKLVVYKYTDDEESFTADLSNELTYKYPDKVIIIARHRNDEYRCSLRSGTIEIRTKLLEALKQVEGYGGGHDKACGANIKERDFERFLEIFRELI